MLLNPSVVGMTLAMKTRGANSRLHLDFWRHGKSLSEEVAPEPWPLTPGPTRSGHR